MVFSTHKTDKGPPVSTQDVPVSTQAKYPVSTTKYTGSTSNYRAIKYRVNQESVFFLFRKFNGYCDAALNLGSPDKSFDVLEFMCCTVDSAW